MARDHDGNAVRPFARPTARTALKAPTAVATCS
jgi:hypothetical protein